MADQRLIHARRLVLPALCLLTCVAIAGGPGLLVARERPVGSTQNCVTSECHTGVVRAKVVHGPVAQRKCDACHVEVDTAAHHFEVVGDPAKLCTTCHSRSERTYVHLPVRQGNCTGCHDPHGSEQPYMLVADPTGGLCVTCHQQDTGADRAFVHDPVAIGACILCHEAHSSWHPALLTEAPRDLCLGCHSEVERDPVQDRYRHVPFESDCLVCHDAHASDVRHHLLESAPDLCYRCHESMRDELRAATVVHGAVTQEGGCLVCHSAHASAFPALQRRPDIELCLNCHDKPFATADDRVLTDMSALLALNPNHHGPIRDGTCATCHLSHASSESNLLRKSYPPEFYAPFDPARYALCFECHFPEMVTSEHGTGATRFRHGDLNLHWLHVNREKGRTCRACHEVHAAQRAFHIRESVPFGAQKWLLAVGFTRTETGGSCAPGCHRTETYDRTFDPDDLEAASESESTP